MQKKLNIYKIKSDIHGKPPKGSTIEEPILKCKCVECKENFNILYQSMDEILNILTSMNNSIAWMSGDINLNNEKMQLKDKFETPLYINYVDNNSPIYNLQNKIIETINKGEK